MTAKLFIQAIIKFLAGVILIGLLIFLPAGTFSFFNGWLFIKSTKKSTSISQEENNTFFHSIQAVSRQKV